MTRWDTAGILRIAPRIASTIILVTRLHGLSRRFPLGRVSLMCLALTCLSSAGETSWATESIGSVHRRTGMNGIVWDFGRSTDTNFDGRLGDGDGWDRCTEIGYPKYVTVKIEPHSIELEKTFRELDRMIFPYWPTLPDIWPLRKYWKLAPLPPAMTDMVVDRYLKIELDGGQMKLESPAVETSGAYQYRFSCRIATNGLRHDTAYAELVFLGKDGKTVVASHATERVKGTTPWTTVRIDGIHPPVDAAMMRVRLLVQNAEDGLEDIHGTIGFDDLHIDRDPQIQLATNAPLGIYDRDEPIETTAKVMGLPTGTSQILFRLHSVDGTMIRSQSISVDRRKELPQDSGAPDDPIRSEVTWNLGKLPLGFYRVTAGLEGSDAAALATDTTLAVIQTLVNGPPRGSFGWTLPEGAHGIEPHDLASWLAKLGVAWVKYPCWLAPNDHVSAERVAVIFTKLQDAGIETIGLLDKPPEDQLQHYALRHGSTVTADELFRDMEVWQPLLEPVMTRMTLKVRLWQLGADRDHSFLGRPRLQESIQQISTRLQGYGQPIDVALSWPWLEPQADHGESTWQAICRSSDKPLIAKELDAFLSLNGTQERGNPVRTWLLVDPVSASKYSREERIRDLVLRMATVRNHRVEAAFISDPRHPQQGLLRADGRPGELLLPWRTTSRLIGDLRQVGSLQLRSGAQNAVFTNHGRAVMLVWSAEPTEELMYLGDGVQVVDVWGEVKDVPVEQQSGQSVQRIKIGRVPTFITGIDQALLALRMSVAFDQDQIDSFLGQVQRLSLSFTNPTRDSLAGDLRIIPPDRWAIESPKRSWEMLGGRRTNEPFNVVLGSSAKIGTYEIPIRFELLSVPPKRFTVYRKVTVGPKGVELKVNTRLLPNSGLRVRIEITNQSQREQTYDCKVFPPGRQYLRRFITARPGETTQRDIFLANADDLVGREMLLRAVEQDGRRILNYTVDVRR